MIKVLDCKNKNYKSNLVSFLEKRRTYKKINTNVVLKILNDIKKKKYSALLKYEKKFGNNKEIKISKKKISKIIKKLDPKVKKAIDFAFNRIFKFHSKQITKNIYFKDKLNNVLQYKYIPIESVDSPVNLSPTKRSPVLAVVLLIETNDNTGKVGELTLLDSNIP